MGHPYNKADKHGFDPKKETSLAATKQLKLLLKFSCCYTAQARPSPVSALVQHFHILLIMISEDVKGLKDLITVKSIK